MREVNDDARIEARLSQPQAETRQVKLEGRAHQGDRRRAQAPRHENASNPPASAPAFDDQGPRNLERQIADEKNTGPKSIYPFVETEFLGHRQLGEGKIRPV